MQSSRIYLDHAASTPLAPAAQEAMKSALGAFANPSSAHEEGRRAKDLLEDARGRCARVLGCRPREVLFTASGTLASQLALRGAALARRATHGPVVLTAIEHPSVQAAATALERDGFNVVRVPPTSDGTVAADAFLAAVGDDAAVAAMMLASHETGVLLPVAEVGAALRARGVPFVCDACLGPGRVPCTQAALPADLIIHSAHKWGGPAASASSKFDAARESRPSSKAAYRRRVSIQAHRTSSGSSGRPPRSKPR